MLQHEIWKTGHESVWLQAEPQIKLELIECLDLWRCNCLDTCVRSMADQYLYNINRSQRASRLRLSGAQTTWNKTLFDVALWADNWQLPRAKQDLVGKENLNTSTVLDDLLYFQVVLSGQLMCLSHASLRLDEVYYFSALVHNITINTPTFLSSCYPGTQTLLFLTQGNDGLWHGNTENPVRSCLKLWNINVSLGKTCHCEKCLKD